MLADVPVGESPAGGTCSVATAVIPDNGKGNQPAGSSGVKVSVGWVEYPVRSAREASNSTGRSESELSEAAKFSSHLKRMMGVLGSAEPFYSWRRPASSAKVLSTGNRWTPRGRRRRHAEKERQRKHGTTRGSPRQECTAKAARISR